jgi:phage shock protein D
MSYYTQTAPRNGRVLKKMARLGLMLALSYGPAGIATRLLGVVRHGPLRFLLALILEPLLRRGLNRVFGRLAKESNEKITK